jgi:hypothetical protein
VKIRRVARSDLWEFARYRVYGGRVVVGKGRRSRKRLETLAFDGIVAPSWRADGFILAGGSGLRGAQERVRAGRLVRWYYRLAIIIRIYIFAFSISIQRGESV